MMQSEFGEICKSLGAHGVEVSPVYFAFDAADGGGGLVGEYIIPLAQAIGPTLGVVLVAWLQGRSGRKVRLRVKDVEVEAQTEDEVRTLIKNEVKTLLKLQQIQTENKNERIRRK